MAWAFRFFDTMEFLGLRKGVQEKPVISKHGLYGIVRHPMYLGGFIYLTAAATDAPLAQFLGYFILAVYMLIGTVREDKRLANELGKIYRDYQKEVPMFLPRFILKKRLTGSRDKG